MKIAQITHSYLPNIGGIENYIKRLTQFLEKEGHDVKIYTTDWRVKGKLEENTFYCHADFTIPTSRNPISFEMYKRLKEGNEDVYHFHAPWLFVHILAERAVKNKPKVMTLHGIQLTGSPHVFVVNTFYYPMMKHILNKMNILIAQAENEKQIVVKRYKIPPEKVEIIPNGIETEKFKCSEKDCRNFIRKYGINEKALKILFVGRLVPHKHPDKLIKAIKFIKEENIEVLIIGSIISKNYFEMLKKLAKNDKRIKIIGEVNFNDLVAAYNSSDLFIFLSTWDALSAVVLEAMCCGLPVISTKTGCVPFIVEEGKNGFFVNKLDEREIAEKISMVLNLSNSELTKIRKNNMKKIKKEYEWGEKAKDILKVYEKLTG
jgi:glycosyltransferase involved in cell wall biosynthesis